MTLALSTVELTGAVHSYDLSVGVDGPGTRFVVFLAGCPLRCRYCHSPDTWTGRGATRRSVADLAEKLGRYRRFIDVAGGGFTVSGGEPLLQHRFSAALLHEARQMGLHTALDTSGYLGDRADDALLDDTDLVLLDVKSWHPDTYRAVTGRDVEPTLRFARRLAERGTRMWIRFVLVPGLTDEPSNVDGVVRFAAGLSTVERVEVLPFHRLGAQKYAELGLAYPLPDAMPPDPALCERVRRQFEGYGLAVY